MNTVSDHDSPWSGFILDKRSSAHKCRQLNSPASKSEALLLSGWLVAAFTAARLDAPMSVTDTYFS